MSIDLEYCMYKIPFRYFLLRLHWFCGFNKIGGDSILRYLCEIIAFPTFVWSLRVAESRDRHRY